MYSRMPLIERVRQCIKDEDVRQGTEALKRDIMRGKYWTFSKGVECFKLIL